MIFTSLTEFGREFQILPRVTDISILNTVMTITNQSTNVVASTGESYSYDSNGILTIGLSGTLEEGSFYTIELNGIGQQFSDVVKWKGIIFASDQEKEDYTINSGEFKENTSNNNDYIILD